MALLVPQSMKQTLVPIWIVESDNPALARMTRRPVLIAIDELDLTMRGQAVDMTMTYAILRPESQFYLCKCVYIEVSFRFEATRYTLSGTAQRSLADQSFRIDFDSVARKTVAGLNERLQEAGLIEAGKPERTPSAPAPVEEPAEAEAKPPAAEQPVAEQPAGRRVRHDGPPDGIERRVCPRFDVETYTRLTLVDEGRRVDCIMIDLSQSGCRLYFEQPHGLACGLHVEVQFIGDGLPLRLAAVVQVCHHAQVVGLRFINVGTRMQERIEWLIGEVAAGRAIALPKS
jgi:hypothetical protein